MIYYIYKKLKGEINMSDKKEKFTPKKKKNNKRKAVQKPLTQGVDLREWLAKYGMPKEEEQRE